MKKKSIWFLLIGLAIFGFFQIGIAYAQKPAITEFGSVMNVGEYVTAALKWILPVIGALAVGMFVWAGYLFMTSAGNPESVKQAKEIIVSTIAGILLLFLMNILLQQVIGNFGSTGSTVSLTGPTPGSPPITTPTGPPPTTKPEDKLPWWLQAVNNLPGAKWIKDILKD